MLAKLTLLVLAGCGSLRHMSYSVSETCINMSVMKLFSFHVGFVVIIAIMHHCG